jgi:hypothetical protein
MIFETPTVAGIAAGNVITPTRLEQTPVSYMFFHPTNVESLHTSIRYRVHQRTGLVIDRQGDNQLRTLMTSVYQDSQSPTMESAFASSRIHEIVRGLNSRVVHRAVHEVLNSINMHSYYMEDIATPVPQPMERSLYSNQRQRQQSLEFPIGFGTLY